MGDYPVNPFHSTVLIFGSVYVYAWCGKCLRHYPLNMRMEFVGDVLGDGGEPSG